MPPDYNCDRPLKPVSTTKTRSLSQQGNKLLFTVTSIEKSWKGPNKLCRQKTTGFVCCVVKVREKYFKTKKKNTGLHCILYYVSIIIPAPEKQVSRKKRQKVNRQTTYFGILFNLLNPELNPISCLLALLAHHFLHVSRIRVKSLTLRLLMSYIYMEHLFLMFLDHTQRRSTVGRTPLDE